MAIFNNEAIAESDNTIIVENNHYFPADSVNMEYFSKNGDTYTCPWKGHCSYFDVTVDGEVAQGAAWMYPEPKEEAIEIAGRFAFWKGVKVVE